MPDKRTAADQVVAFWDALVLDRPTEDFDVDEDLAASLEHLQELGSGAPAPARERVWQRLQPPLASADQHGTPSASVIPRDRMSPLPSPSPSEPAPQPGRTQALRMLAQLATAAMLLLTLGLGYRTLGPGRPGDDQAGDLPAAIEAPVAEPAVETLFAMTLPAEEVPAAGLLHFAFWRLSLEPDVSTPMSSETPSCCHGPRLTHVLEGELTVRADGPMQVFRGAERAQDGADVAPDTELVVRPGDTVVHDFAVPATYANHGTIPVQLATAGLSSGTSLDVWWEHTNYLDGTKQNLEGPLPAGPVEFTILRADLPPDGEFPAPPPGSHVLEVGAAGDASVGTSADGSLFNINDETETIYILLLEPRGTPVLTP